MDLDFTSIRIVSLEDHMTVESPDDPSLQYIFLRLSATPPPIWTSCFNESRKISRHPHWRRAWIDRKFIVLECHPDELEKYHLADLRYDLRQANERTLAHFDVRSREDRQKQENNREMLDRMKQIKGRLNFD